MNLEVDVMEGDQISHIDGIVSQQREGKYRNIRWRHKGEWTDGGPFDSETPLDIPTFTRYCEGCGLTVKIVKPEPVDDGLGCLVKGCECWRKKQTKITSRPAAPPNVIVDPVKGTETIKPPEFWLEWNDGGYTPCVGEPEAKRKSNALESLVRRVVRIDWGAQ